MPEFVALAIADMGVIDIAGLTLFQATAVAFTIGNMAYSAQQQRQAHAQAREQYNAAQVDRLVNTSSPVAPRELCLGRVRKGGQVFFKGSAGTNKTTFCAAIALAGHEIDAVEQIYLNDVAVTLDAAGNVTDAPYTSGGAISATVFTATGSVTLDHTPIAGSVSAHRSNGFVGVDYEAIAVPVTVAGSVVTITDGNPSLYTITVQYQYADTASSAKVWWYLGAAGQVADPRLIELFPTLWTTACTVSGVAYLVCEFTFSETAFPTGIPNVTALIRGAKVYDPRSGLTAWSDNPALLLRHAYTHANFGKATSVSAAEDVRFTAAANACDVAQGYVVSGVTTTQAIYKAALVAQYGTPARAVFDDLAQAMAGMWAFAGGELYVKAGAYTASVMALTDADLAVVTRAGAGETQHQIQISTHRERAQRFNTVKPRIWDSAQSYKQVDLTPLTDAALVTRDGATLTREVTLAAVGYAPQALHIAGVLMRDARDPLAVVLPFKLRAYPLELFDTVTLTLTRYGWSAKTFTVIGREWTQDGFLQLTLKETNAAIFTPDASFSAQGFGLNTSLPSPWSLPTPGALTISSGSNELLLGNDGSVLTRMRVSWPAITDSSVTIGGKVELQYRIGTDTGAWTSVLVDGAESFALVAGVQDAVSYVVRARCRNSVAVGLWSVQVAHSVIGKTEPPANFDSFTISAAPDGTRIATFAYSTTARPADYAGAAIRWYLGTILTTTPGFSFTGSMTALHSGVLTESPFDFNSLVAGTYTFGICAVDTSGNYAATPLLTTVTLPARRLGKTLAEYQEQPTWPDTKGSCAVSAAGYLVANSTTTWTSVGTWTGTWAGTPSSPITYTGAVKDLGATVTSGTITASSSGLGTILIEQRSSNISSVDCAAAGWVAIGTAITARWIQVRATITATGPAPVPTLYSLSYYATAP